MVNTIRKNMVHIAFTDEEKDEISKFAKESNMTISEFCRQSIFDKIRKIEHPEVFQISKGSFDINQVKAMMEMLSVNNERINEILEKMNVITKIQDTLKALQTLVEQPKIKEKEAIVIDVLKQHTELKIKDIIEYTGLSKEDIYDVISNANIFSVDLKTGGIKLNE